MADERLKVEMLRFVDVFPTLRSREEIARHLREYFARQGIAAPAALRWGISLTGQRSPVAPLASAVIRRQMSSFAQRFIVGRDARSAVPALRTLRREGVGFTLDVLGEATVSEAEGLAYQRTYLDLLDGLAAEAASWPAIASIDQAAWGPLPRVNLSLKITSLYSQIDPVDFAGSAAHVKDLLRPIFRKGIRTGAALTLDLEQFRFRDLTLEVFMSLLDEEEFREYHDAGLVLQAYLRDADQDLARLVAWARERGRPFHLRLVKGAYWDYETVIAAQEGWPVPVFTHKPDTDAMYEKLTRQMLEAADVVRPAFASHNVRSLAVAIETARELGLAPGRVRAPDAPRHGRPDQGRRGRHGPARARVRAGRRAHPGHGVPRAPAAGEHGQRLVPAPDVRGGGGGRRAHPPARDLRRLRRGAAAPAGGGAHGPARTRDLPQPAARGLLAAREPRRLRRGARRSARPLRARTTRCASAAATSRRRGRWTR